jgi:uncharacterized membrane-anchored protein YitT (DUF2179 family)
MAGKKTKAITDYALLAAGDFVVACAVFFFLMPSHTAISSVSGLAIVLHNFVPLPVAALVFLINLGLLVLGWAVVGPQFGLRTIYTSLLLPVFLALLEHCFPAFSSITNDQLLDALSYVFVCSLGQAFLFKRNASSGGIDIIAKILNHCLHMELGTASMLAGMGIALSAAFVYDGRTVVISVLGTFAGGLVLDYFLFGIDLKRRVTVVSHHEKELVDFIVHDLHSGASVYEFYGAYHMEPRREVVAIVNREEYRRLMNYVQKTDPDALITVYNVNDMHYLPKPRA